MTSILAVPGLERTSEAFRQKLAVIAERNGWDPDVIAAIISSESAGTFAPDAGWNLWSPARTATGLIQFIESTAKWLGVKPASKSTRHPELTARATGATKQWATWALMDQSAEEQLDLVEEYFSRTFGSFKPTRAVDYYLVTWGAKPGLSLDTILAKRGEPAYTANSALDAKDSGFIRVSDLDRMVQGRLAKAGGNRVEVPIAVAGTGQAAALAVGLAALALARALKHALKG